VKQRLLSIFLLLPLLAAAADTLDIYWIDVEGGAATLIVTPAGETVLMDAGWPGFENRDAKRIQSVLTGQAKASKIDYFITSHFHADHAGGIPNLAAIVPISKFVDHGDSVEKDQTRGGELFAAYLKVTEGKRMQVKPGDKLPLKGVDLQFVAAHSQFIAKPSGAAKPNPLCEGAETAKEDPSENGKSAGFVLRMGKFDLLDLGDLTKIYEHQLACPVNLLGEVDLYQVTHHGANTSGAAELVLAANPTVAVMNNGPTKGGDAEAFQVLKRAPAFQDLWQGHYATRSTEQQNTAKNLIANMEPTEQCQGHWIKAAVRKDGAFTVTNGRNGHSKTYQSR
jgi:beta-lactamase superfamily II metal-dependent hydrolase